jgi:hypothetical protein
MSKKYRWRPKRKGGSKENCNKSNQKINPMPFKVQDRVDVKLCDFSS